MKKEVIWFLVTLLISLMVQICIFGIHALHPFSELNLQFHDTYIILLGYHSFLLILVFVTFVVYLFRVIFTRFKNIFANIVFAVSALISGLITYNALKVSLPYLTPTSIYTEGGWIIKKAGFYI